MPGGPKSTLPAGYASAAKPPVAASAQDDSAAPSAGGGAAASKSMFSVFSAEESTSQTQSRATIACGIRESMPLFESEKPNGSISVEQPETTGSMARYTTYLVVGTLDGVHFQQRKRYSDFEWLRKALVSHFPGVLVPPIPKKQLMNRFDEAVIEVRRSGLEEFLRRCACKKQIVRDTPLLRGFLQQPLDGMEELKKQFDNRPIGEMCREFKVAFASELRNMSVDKTPTDDSQLEQCREFLEAQVVCLRDLTAELGHAADAQRSVNTAVVAAQKKLAVLCCEEPAHGAPARPRRAGNGEQQRNELLATLRQQQPTLDKAPCLHYDLLQVAADREIEDAEAMQDALRSLQELRDSMTEAKRRVNADEAGLLALQGSGSTGSWASVTGMFNTKDKAAQEADLRSSLERHSTKAVLSEEWYLAARSIAIGREVEAFFLEKSALHEWAKCQFAKRSHETARAVSEIWGRAAPAGAPEH
eukprot:gnl/TRDRNA2_/TRDRNA2_145879_c1_seq1.p1 gnl/TRDRNA2_/TRDRNA2_145879_c1~~gnl/TRDRNA2_/TRDRNA2_145879_c1_seq1.p1  ORF type:complete len:474 (-),score=109.46 gnl/TRDRNA2_/TRDRNA2_145879_c1_seq1:18-1439(-)